VRRVINVQVAVVANSFVIREIDPDSEDFMFSSNIFDVAERNNLWSRASGKKLDFLVTYAPQRSHPEYSNRRKWRTFNMVAPSLKLPGDTNPTADDYPFSVKPDKKLTAEDLIAIHRDHYEGAATLYIILACSYELLLRSGHSHQPLAQLSVLLFISVPTALLARRAAYNYSRKHC
jgi:dipeptidase